MEHYPEPLTVGQYVTILRPRKIWSSRLSKHIVQIDQIPGIVREVVEGGGAYMVAYYGPPGHFTTRAMLRQGKAFQVLRERFTRSELVKRQPNYDDALEFMP